MSYAYIKLRADTEQDAMNAAIAAAELPEHQRFVLLAPDENGDLQWQLASEQHAFFPSGPRIISPGAYDENGTEITPPEIDTRFHAILAVRPSMEAAMRQVLQDVGLLSSVEMDTDVGFEVMGVSK
ncbi:MAG: hypothetical protein CME90_10975 [Hoeflea sp.]|nr:hypothetical protein [Hoeflea sp.]|tara:strand:- start:154 stop:531 length:378 start_codon:yes stop_codon:yes gene_type:complete